MNKKYKDYLQSKHWLETKDYFSVISKRRCYCCGSPKFLSVHHKHYKTIGYEDGSELVWLCPKHHKEVHFQEGKFESPDSDNDINKLAQRLEVIRERHFPRKKPKVFKPVIKGVSIHQQHKKFNFHYSIAQDEIIRELGITEEEEEFYNRFHI